MSELAVSSKSKASTAGDRTLAPSIAAELPVDGEPAAGIMIEFNGLSVANASMAQQQWQLMNQGARKLASAAQDGCSIAVKESLDYGLNAMQAAQSHMNAALELASALTTAKSQADMIELSTAHARRQLDFLMDQNRRVWVTAQKIMRGLIDPQVAKPAKAPHAKP